VVTTRPPVTSGPPVVTTRPPVTSAAPTSPSTGAGCKVGYSLNDWGSGFVGTVTITNGSSAAISTWKLQWTFGGNQNITSYWNAAVTQSGQAVTATNPSYGATIPAGGSLQFGFQGTYSGTNAVPAQFTLNGTACAKA
jgi:cellulase/cellobiase CelA1